MTQFSDYNAKRAYFERMLTVYGRKPALEALQNETLQCHTLHVAQSNRETGIIADILQCARHRGIPVERHTREALARISKNGKQDQGIALDIQCPSFRTLAEYLQTPPTQPQRLLALDGISNPQNLGMLIRSATAGDIDGIILPRRGNAALGPLVIKASAGTVYRAPLLLCPSLLEALNHCRAQGAQVCTLDAQSTHSFFHHNEQAWCIYVLGNETQGVTAAVRNIADVALSIPMHNGVESLNVAVTAGVIAFGSYRDR